MMREKIEWYREVLELEPNSKVFFPLARLLVQENQTDAAIDTLVQGLERHREYLDARLFLIELLHKTGRKRECDEQVSRLAAIFASYACFWEAWAACLASKEADAASALRYLAAQFVSGPLSWSDVIDRGVNVILQERLARAGEATTAPLPSTADKPAPETEDATPASIDNEAAPPATAVAADAPQSGPAKGATKTEPLETVRLQTPETDVAEAEKGMIMEMALPEDEAPDANLPLVEQMAEPLETGDEEIIEDLPLSHPRVFDLETNSDAVFPADAPRNDDQGEIGKNIDLSDEEDITEEHLSVRTRSMAEVLASQGDFEGALDIYRELAEAASDPAEKAALRERISELEKSGEQFVETESSPVSKEKLIDILEALAQRVEERVNNPADF